MTNAPAVFDPLAEGFAESPYEQYARLRDHDPVHRSELLQGWVVTRFDDVGKLLRDPTVSSDIHNATPTPLTIMELEQLSEQPRASRTLVLRDDPDHARIRAFMAEPFRPREIEKLRDRVTARIAAAFDQLREQHGSGPVELDLVSEFAYPLPVEIFSEMLGMPEEDSPRFRYWTQCVARSVDPIMSAAERDECLRGLDEMYAYLEEHADMKRADPADDLMSTLVYA
jgi:cytochrome P450